MKIEWIEKYLSEAEQLLYNSEVNEGLSLLNNLLYEEPGYARLHNHLGWAYLYYTSEEAQAELHLKMAIQFDASYPAPYLHMATLYTRLGRYAEALQYAQKGLEKPNANKVALLEAIGVAHEMKREFSKAIKAYREAMLASVGYEMPGLVECIQRCRKKRMARLFIF